MKEGERVVVSANFLIDAESNLRAALQGMASAQSTPPAYDMGAHDMSGHGMPAAADGAHAEHAMPTTSTPDPHAGHVMPAAPKPASHADHEIPPPKADPHANHDMSDRER